MLELVKGYYRRTELTETVPVIIINPQRACARGLQ